MPDRIHIPDVIEPDERLPRDLVALRRFATIMDEMFEVPGTRMRFGVDAVLGLIPGVGDVIGGMMSTWIVLGALRHRVPPWIIARMVWNIAVDLLFGAVPLAGDIFDFLFEENMRNMRLLEKYRDRSRPPRTTGQIALIFTIIFLFVSGLALGLVGAMLALVFWLIGQR